MTPVTREPRSDAPARARRVLVVEDDRLAAESTLELLRTWAYTAMRKIGRRHRPPTSTTIW